MHMHTADTTEVSDELLLKVRSLHLPGVRGVERGESGKAMLIKVTNTSTAILQDLSAVLRSKGVLCPIDFKSVVQPAAVQDEQQQSLEMTAETDEKEAFAA